MVLYELPSSLGKSAFAPGFAGVSNPKSFFRSERTAICVPKLHAGFHGYMNTPCAVRKPPGKFCIFHPKFNH